MRVHDLRAIVVTAHPTVVILGNTLKMEQRELWYTPAHIMGDWGNKFRTLEFFNSLRGMMSVTKGIVPIQSRRRSPQFPNTVDRSKTAFRGGQIV